MLLCPQRSNPTLGGCRRASSANLCKALWEPGGIPDSYSSLSSSSPQCLHQRGRFRTTAVDACPHASNRQHAATQGVIARTPMPSASCVKWPGTVRFLPGSPPQLLPVQQFRDKLDRPAGCRLHDVSTRKHAVARARVSRGAVLRAVGVSVEAGRNHPYLGSGVRPARPRGARPGNPFAPTQSQGRQPAWLARPWREGCRTAAIQSSAGTGQCTKETVIRNGTGRPQARAG